MIVKFDKAYANGNLCDFIDGKHICKCDKDDNVIILECDGIKVFNFNYRVDLFGNSGYEVLTFDKNSFRID